MNQLELLPALLNWTGGEMNGSALLMASVAISGLGSLLDTLPVAVLLAVVLAAGGMWPGPVVWQRLSRAGVILATLAVGGVLSVWLAQVSLLQPSAGQPSAIEPLVWSLRASPNASVDDAHTNPSTGAASAAKDFRVPLTTHWGQRLLQARLSLTPENIVLVFLALLGLVVAHRLQAASSRPGIQAVGESVVAACLLLSLMTDDLLIWQTAVSAAAVILAGLVGHYGSLERKPAMERWLSRQILGHGLTSAGVIGLAVAATWLLQDVAPVRPEPSAQLSELLSWGTTWPERNPLSLAYWSQVTPYLAIAWLIGVLCLASLYPTHGPLFKLLTECPGSVGLLVMVGYVPCVVRAWPAWVLPLVTEAAGGWEFPLRALWLVGALVMALLVLAYPDPRRKLTAAGLYWLQISACAFWSGGTTGRVAGVLLLCMIAATQLLGWLGIELLERRVGRANTEQVAGLSQTSFPLAVCWTLVIAIGFIAPGLAALQTIAFLIQSWGTFSGSAAVLAASWLVMTTAAVRWLVTFVGGSPVDAPQANWFEGVREYERWRSDVMSGSDAVTSKAPTPFAGVPKKAVPEVATLPINTAVAGPAETPRSPAAAHISASWSWRGAFAWSGSIGGSSSAASATSSVSATSAQWSSRETGTSSSFTSPFSTSRPDEPTRASRPVDWSPRAEDRLVWPLVAVVVVFLMTPGSQALLLAPPTQAASPDPAASDRATEGQRVRATPQPTARRTVEHVARPSATDVSLAGSLRKRVSQPSSARGTQP